MIENRQINRKSFSGFENLKTQWKHLPLLKDSLEKVKTKFRNDRKIYPKVRVAYELATQEIQFFGQKMQYSTQLQKVILETK